MPLYAENTAPILSASHSKSQLGEALVTAARKTLIGTDCNSWIHSKYNVRGKNNIMRHIVSAAFGLWLCLGTPVQAQSQQGLVVELYTSQGCSSCPPADEHFATIVNAPGIIALSLHVDYWDYIGWTDTFANPEFGARQKRYAKASGKNMVYTPQIIVGGRDRVEGNQPSKVAKAIANGEGFGSDVVLTLTRDGDLVTIRAKSGAAVPAGTRVQLVRYTKNASVEIKRGENAGRQINYHNIVTSWTDVGAWSGDQPLEMSARAPGAAPVVVIIQAGGPTEILAAAELK